MDNTPESEPARQGRWLRNIVIACVVVLLPIGGAGIWFYRTHGPAEAVQAARDGDLKTLKLILAVRPSLLDRHDPASGDTLLTVAAGHGQTRVVEYLLNRGADPAQLDGDGCSAFAPAMCYYPEVTDLEMIRLLLKHGADPNQIIPAADGHQKCRAVSSAIREQWEEVLELLLDHGADPNALDPMFDKTPVVLAIEEDWPKAVEILLDHGAQMNPADAEAVQPLRFAALKRNFAVVDLLLRRGADVNARGHDGCTVLEFACGNSGPDIVQRLLLREAQADPAFLAPALGRLAADGRVEAVDDFLRTWPLIDRPSTHKPADGRTLLHMAVADGDEKLVEILIARQAKVNIRDKAGRTPLDLAVAREPPVPAIALALVAAGGQGTPTTVYQALKMALAARKPELCRTLLADDVVLNKTRDVKGNGLLQFAILEGEADLVELLLVAGAQPKTLNWDGLSPIHMAVTAPQSAGRIVGLLLKAGADANVTDLYDRTPLHHAARAGTPVEILKPLLAAGVDVNARDTESMTALLYATGRGDIENVKLLLEHKADPNKRDAKGQTPLHLAALANNVELVRILLDGGANTRIRDNQHMLARVYAGQRGFKEVEAMILKLEPQHSFEGDRRTPAPR